MPDPTMGLRWAIKASFLSYARRLPDCQVFVREGAGYHNGRFHFPPAPDSEYDPATDAGTLRFAGDVRVIGHHGMLHVMIQDPWLEIDGRRGTLTVADPDYHPDRSRRLALVELSMATPAEVIGHREWRRISTALRPEATALFGNTYAPGEAFDPVDVTVAVNGPGSPGPPVEMTVGTGI